MIYIERNTPLILQFTYDGIYTLPLFHMYFIATISISSYQFVNYFLFHMYFICISSYQLVHHFHLVVASCCCHPNYFPFHQNYFAVCCLLLAPTMLACNLNNEHDETTFLLPCLRNKSINGTPSQNEKYPQGRLAGLECHMIWQRQTMHTFSKLLVRSLVGKTTHEQA